MTRAGCAWMFIAKAKRAAGRYDFNRLCRRRRPARWRCKRKVCKEEERPSDNGLLLSALNREDARQQVGRRSATVCCMQTKRAMRERQSRFLPGWGIS